MAEKKNPDQVWREKKDDEEEDDPREKVSNHSSDDEESDSDNYQSGEDDIDGAIAAAGDQGITRELLDLRLKAGKEEPELEPILSSVDFDGIIDFIKSGKVKNIITMAGAGISTSAGIPDFRTPGSGLYDNLQKYDLPDPQAIFDIQFFRTNPEPFFQLAKELYPGNFQPTPSHYFIKLLERKGLLLRHYTQNIDTLERVAEISGDKLIEAHGTFYTAHCLKCRKEYPQEFVKDAIFSETTSIPRCTKPGCSGVVKPDIVFFGENLPENFHRSVPRDFPKCDLLIIMGTSLMVQPFAGLVENVGDDCPRLLINMEKAGNSASSYIARLLGGRDRGLDFDSPSNRRDVAKLGKCDDICFEFAEKMGWKEDFEELMKEKSH